MSKKIGITCDHAGFQMKEFLVGYLSSKGLEVLDYGCYSEESVDYPDMAHALAKGYDAAEISRGIGLCGSGEGMAIALNKHQQIRAGLCWNVEVAKLIRQHNDANVLVLPARFVDNDEAVAMVDAWLETEFEGGRHQKRVDKIACK
ncbi:MAG: ribose 5-phosphate isomerase B [Rikenellaceae bacterium]